MSYINQAQDPRRRATAIAVTTAVHAAIAAGLVLGLTISGVAPVPDIFTAVPLTPDPEPTPPPDQPQKQEPQDSFIVAPPPPLGPLVSDPIDVVVVDRIPEPQFVVDPRPVIEPVVEPVRPAFTPRGARPSNNASRWITNDDYPARPLLDGAEGIAAYRLIVGTNGRVAACVVTRSTGNGRLDDATCDFIERRARFEPATDSTGAKVVGSYTGTVKWDIPD
jgi:protein TonB